MTMVAPKKRRNKKSENHHRAYGFSYEKFLQLEIKFTHIYKQLQLFYYIRGCWKA